MEIVHIKDNILEVFSFLPPFLFFKILSGDKGEKYLCTVSLYILMSEDSLCTFVRLPGSQGGNHDGVIIALKLEAKLVRTSSEVLLGSLQGEENWK